MSWKTTIEIAAVPVFAKKKLLHKRMIDFIYKFNFCKSIQIGYIPYLYATNDNLKFLDYVSESFNNQSALDFFSRFP